MSDQTPTDPKEVIAAFVLSMDTREGQRLLAAINALRDSDRAAEREQHQREIAQQAETIRQLQAQIANVTAERNTADAWLAEVELERDAAEARIATLTKALEQAKERAEIAKAFLHESGTDPEAWLDEAIAACAEALQGRETPTDPQKGAPR